MVAKRGMNRGYRTHGDGVGSLHAGFDELAMPEEARAGAMEIVREVLATNHVRDFYWYRPPGTKELSCYWDDAERNLLWITASEVHVPSGPDVKLPPRPLTWSKAKGRYVGWLLPGAKAGRGRSVASPSRAESAMVRCPLTLIEQPAGQECPDCEVIHPW